MTNYRPISLLPIFSKIFEKAFLVRLNSFINSFNILSDHQFGFRENKCCLDAINHLLEQITDSLECKQKTLAIFLDLTKAFDCVEHEKLLKILMGYGIRGLSFLWISSYLNQRTQQVQVDNLLSDRTEVKCGVPQGSILGPVLFILYVNKLNKLNGINKMVQYADDTTLIQSASTIPSLEEQTYVSANLCLQYFEKLNLLINYQKTNFIYFNISKTDNKEIPIVMLNDNIVEQVDRVKFLGLNIDSKLTWEYQIDTLSRKMCSSIFLLRHLSRYCSLDVLKTAYYGLIHSVMSYGVCFWGNCSKIKMLQIFILQKSAIRIMYKLNNRDSCRNAFQKLNILTFPSLYIYETIVYCMSKCNMVQGIEIHSHGTRSATDFRVNQHRTELYSKLPSQAGITLLNTLPNSMKNVENFEIFKIKLKHFLLSNTFYSIEEFIEKSVSLRNCT